MRPEHQWSTRGSARGCHCLAPVLRRVERFEKLAPARRIRLIGAEDVAQKLNDLVLFVSFVNLSCHAGPRVLGSRSAASAGACAGGLANFSIRGIMSAWDAGAGALRTFFCWAAFRRPRIGDFSSGSRFTGQLLSAAGCRAPVLKSSRPPHASLATAVRSRLLERKAAVGEHRTSWGSGFRRPSSQAPLPTRVT